MNLYRCTINEHWTNGTQNAKLGHADRTPGYYRYAEDEAGAKRQMEELFPDSTFLVTLEEAGANMPFKSEKKTATAVSL